MRDASPPTDVGNTCPTAYETTYARASQRRFSRIPRARSSSCQRHATGKMFARIRNAASATQRGFALPMMCAVVWTSILRRMYVNASARTISVAAICDGRFIGKGDRARGRRAPRRVAEAGAHFSSRKPLALRGDGGYAVPGGLVLLPTGAAVRRVPGTHRRQQPVVVSATCCSVTARVTILGDIDRMPDS